MPTKPTKKLKEKAIKLSLPTLITRENVVFPNTVTRIEVGRSLTTAAVNVAINEYDSQIVVVSQKLASVDLPTAKDIYKIGTLAKIRIEKQWDDGSLRVVVDGIERYEIENYIHAKEIYFAEGNLAPIKATESKEEVALSKTVVKSLEELMPKLPEVPNSFFAQLAKGVPSDELANLAANYLPIGLKAKQDILEANTIVIKLEKILNELNNQKQITSLENKISKKIKEKIDETQKEYYLREKLRAIKEELGETGSKNDNADALRDRVNNNPYPKEIKEKLLDELKKFEMSQPGSSEANIIRTYIDWLMELPWWQETTNTVDLTQARAVLDKYHYGLEKIKERIVEYLAVHQNTKKLNGPILCLVGAPGVGKTTFAKSISEAVGRKFIKMSLGGVRDESEIRGHRRTYIGAMPGRIIQGMKKVGVINPLFLLDEIDKMSSDFRGDPASALLEVLDPEQNKAFSDHYLEENYDLSKAMFVATANYLEEIPEPLRDRMEIIQLNSYTEKEKIEIATSHLLPKVLSDHGLKKTQLKITKEILATIIRSYTKEAGVRQLERLLAKITRKTVVKILNEKIKTMNVTLAEIKLMLGNPIFDATENKNTDHIGTVNGLAWTAYGGDILPIETTSFAGENKLTLTGQLGDVMKESANIAYVYIKSKMTEFGISEDQLKKAFHIHVPEGAVKKDGPSAGVTLTTALISTIKKHPISSHVAMTGEITLRGKVLPIGGLKEKLISAARSNVTTVFIPKSNVKDLEEIPAEVKSRLKIYPVKEYSEIYNHLFEAKKDKTKLTSVWNEKLNTTINYQELFGIS